VGDVVLRRADGVVAYHLATALDELIHGITDVVRGDDLWSSTGPQVAVMTLLELPPPRYGHLPLWRSAGGQRQPLHPCPGPGPTALVVGPEDHGLANDEIAHAHALVHIATDAHASLNVSQAVLLLGSFIHTEARRRGFVPRVEGPGRRGGPGRGPAPHAHDARLTAPLGDVEPLVTEWMETLDLSTYLVGHEPLLVQSTLRRILERATLDAGEVSILRGQLRKLRWKMRS
jgi:hypothetical protein